jgi:hypothetical protein
LASSDRGIELFSKIKQPLSCFTAFTSCWEKPSSFAFLITVCIFGELTVSQTMGQINGSAFLANLKKNSKSGSSIRTSAVNRDWLEEERIKTPDRKQRRHGGNLSIILTAAA